MNGNPLGGEERKGCFKKGSVMLKEYISTKGGALARSKAKGR